MHTKCLSGSIMVSLAVLVFPSNTLAASGEVPHSQVRAIAMNLVMMAGFYSECGKRKLVTTNRRAIRFTVYSAGKYAEITGDNKAINGWGNDGNMGFLIKDPTISTEKEKYPFSTQYCSAIKQHLDQSWEVFNKSIIQ